MTVGVPSAYGVACVDQASTETPSTRQPNSTLMIESVRRAFGPAGGLKTLTPLEIASSPVSDEPPLAKARSR